MGTLQLEGRALCAKCLAFHETIYEVEAFDQTIAYCLECYNEFKKKYPQVKI